MACSALCIKILNFLIDINECFDNNLNNCTILSNCINEIGSYTCECMTGYAGDPLVKCDDIDECHERTDECDENAYCINTIGTYECDCYEGNGRP